MSELLEFGLQLCWKEGSQKMEGVQYECGCLYPYSISRNRLKTPEMCIKHKVGLKLGPISKTVLRNYMKKLERQKQNVWL